MMAGPRATQCWLSCCRTKQDEDRALQCRRWRLLSAVPGVPAASCLNGVDVFAPLTVVLASSLQPSGITASPRRR